MKNITSKLLLLLFLIGYMVTISTATAGTNEVAALTHYQQLFSTMPSVAISGEPVRLTIARIGLDLPVVDGVYSPQTHTWSLGRTTAQYAVTTPLPNDLTGNTFIYGHNNAHVFGKLLAIQPGDELVLSMADGKRFHYLYRTSFDVSPLNVEAIKYEGAPVLTIQTCVGQLFEQRRMFRFDFQYAEA